MDFAQAYNFKNWGESSEPSLYFFLSVLGKGWKAEVSSGDMSERDVCSLLTCLNKVLGELRIEGREMVSLVEINIREQKLSKKTSWLP